MSRNWRNDDYKSSFFSRIISINIIRNISGLEIQSRQISSTNDAKRRKSIDIRIFSWLIISILLVSRSPYLTSTNDRQICHLLFYAAAYMSQYSRRFWRNLVYSVSDFSAYITSRIGGRTRLTRRPSVEVDRIIFLLPISVVRDVRRLRRIGRGRKTTTFWRLGICYVSRTEIMTYLRTIEAADDAGFPAVRPTTVVRYLYRSEMIYWKFVVNRNGHANGPSANPTIDDVFTRDEDLSSDLDVIRQIRPS